MTNIITPVRLVVKGGENDSKQCQNHGGGS